MAQRRTPASLVAIAIAALGGAATPLLASDILTSGTKRYSQFDEELVVRDFFQDRRDGFFVDVGCAWPMKNSTTYYLEKHLGWSGIGVDAIPGYAPMWEKDRPRSRFFSFLVTDHSDTIDPFYRTPNPTLSSIKKERIVHG